MNTPQAAVPLYEMPPIDHDRDGTDAPHGHLSPVFFAPLEGFYNIGHGSPCEFAVAATGNRLYLIHSHGEAA